MSPLFAPFSPTKLLPNPYHDSNTTWLPEMTLQLVKAPSGPRSGAFWPTTKG
jgi:hypothetical protein